MTATTEAVGSTAVAAPALEVRGLSSGYGHTTILRDVSLVVPAGGVTAVLGPNGAGKSTLLRSISGLIRPTKGSVLINGTDLTRARPSRRVRHGLCHIPEGRGVFPSLTVRENISIQAERGREREGVERAVEAFPQLGERLTQLAGTMSGGQQQMLAMARAYVRDPTLILVDEASLGLAPLVVDAIFEFLENVARTGTSLLIVDQFATRALAVASTAHVLRRGEFVYSGTAEELLGSNLFEQYIGAA